MAAPGKSKESIVVMSRMDFEIACNIYKRYKTLGMTDEEVSFLLGKRNQYVFFLLDPTRKDKFKTEQLDVLPTILDCHIRDLIPNNLKPGENVRLKSKRILTKYQITYRYTILSPQVEEPDGEFVKTLETGVRKVINPGVHTLTLKLIKDGHFDTERSAISLYLHYKQNLEAPFTIADLQKSLSKCLNKKAGALLQEKVLHTRKYYESLKAQEES